MDYQHPAKANLSIDDSRPHGRGREPEQVGAAGEPSLTVFLRRGRDGPILGCETATAADLDPARSEIWLHTFLRRGFPQVPMGAVNARLAPIPLEDGSTWCAGFSLTASDPRGQPVRAVFSINALKDVARRIRDRVGGSERAGDDDGETEDFYFEVQATVGAGLPAEALPTSFTVIPRGTALAYETVPIAELLADAKPVGEIDRAAAYPVFYTTEAFARAERCAREGGRRHPAAETGAVLVGPLCSCPESGEFFAVVCDVFELLEADQTAYSLSFSSATWGRLERVLRARRSNPETRAHRILGQCHGHVFAPSGHDGRCDSCEKRETCSMTNVFASSSDEVWSRAVFSGKPWGLCHIFGRTAAGEPVQSLFGLQDGRLLPRGFYLIPSFDPRSRGGKPGRAAIAVPAVPRDAGSSCAKLEADRTRKE
jgi:hypothetical protein